MTEYEDSLKASILSILPIFVALIPSYYYFGFELPPAFEWVVWSVVTVIVGLVVTEYIREEVDYRWAVFAGISRWIFVAVTFTLKAVAESAGVEVVSSMSRILTYQFASELPLMIIGYAVGVFLFKQTEK
jgi:hypothetical protein